MHDVRGSPERVHRKAQQRRRHIILLVVMVVLVIAGLSTGGYVLFQKQQVSPQAAKQRTLSSTKEPQSSKSPDKPQEAVAPAPPPKPQRDFTIPPVEGGLAPVISEVKTEQPVVFLTIDDGIHKEPFELELMKKHSLVASLFLTYDHIRAEPEFFRSFIAAGSLIENHTMTHAYLTNLSYAGQKQEICGQADKMEELYGRRPIYVRPPGGHYNDDTRRAAAECGMKAVVMWSAKANGGAMQYQVGNGLRPGDIVLMHFRPEFQQDLQSFVDAMRAAGLHTELLENWID